MKEPWFPRLKKESEMKRSNKRRNFERPPKESDWREKYRETQNELDQVIKEINKRNGWGK